MIAQLPTPPSNDFEHYIMLGLQGIITAIISGWFGYRLGLRSHVFVEKLKIKTSMLPLIEKFIIRVNGGMDDWFGLRPDSISQLLDDNMEEIVWLLCIAVISAFQGFIVQVVFRALAEIIRLLRKLVLKN